jgi:hypothetical protein
MGDYWTNAVRHPEDVGVGHIRRTVVANVAALTTGNGLPIGALEAGAVPLYAHVTVQTAFNGTTPALVVGTTADDDGFAAAAGTAVEATGFKGNLSGALTGHPLAANTVVYAKLTGTGVTTGKAIVTLTFVNKREHEGIPFPAN